MKSSTIKDFRKRLSQLPAVVQEQANKAMSFGKLIHIIQACNSSA